MPLHNRSTLRHLRFRFNVQRETEETAFREKGGGTDCSNCTCSYDDTPATACRNTVLHSTAIVPIETAPASEGTRKQQKPRPPATPRDLVCAASNIEQMGSSRAPALKHLLRLVPLTLILLPLFSPMKASLQSYAPTDAPVQIIKPSDDHKKLIIDKENIKAISKIKGPVATVGVVGKFHSGKSFLMNQLMGKTKGFGIGPSVRPETMGIWMWGEPLKVQLRSGQQLSLIFLDTEGFAATNVSENYDAKIFAIATLISSHLIYNSVKIIDQSEIDYLELLSRRTQLFALRSQLSRAKWNGEFVHDLLSFPPLLWVVQDFVQTTDNNETPTQWLRRLMEAHTRESEEYKISLLDLFKSLECHTLFIPAVKRPLLTDLSQASEEDLTSEYIEERNALTKKLHEVLVPKTKNGKPITGAELAGLLQVLVDAANEGSLADVPSRWSAFVDRLMNSAAEDCSQIYTSEMNSLLEKHNNGPIHDDLFMSARCLEHC